MEEVRKKGISTDEMLKVLDTCYQKVTNGVKYVSPPVEQMAQDYLDKYSDPKQAAKKMITNQVLKCTTSGFITGFGGLVTLPVTVPANVGSVLYVQMRMIACTAYIAGYDLNCDQVQTLVYSCLAGVAVNGLLKKAGVKFGEKIATNLIKKVPGSVLIKINQKVGFRFVTKFGQKGLVNLGKLVPGVGAVVGGSLDFVETKLIGERAYKWFIENKFDETKSNDPIIDMEDFESE